MSEAGEKVFWGSETELEEYGIVPTCDVMLLSLNNCQGSITVTLTPAHRPGRSIYPATDQFATDLWNVFFASIPSVVYRI
jgi:hypothetical protein